MKQYIMTEQIRKSLLGYLLTRPMQDVEGGVNMLRTLPELGPKVEPKPKNKTEGKAPPPPPLPEPRKMKEGK